MPRVTWLIDGSARIQITLGKDSRLSARRREACMLVTGEESESICHPNDILWGSASQHTTCTSLWQREGCLGWAVTEPLHCPLLCELRQANILLLFIHKDLHPLGWHPPSSKTESEPHSICTAVLFPLVKTQSCIFAHYHRFLRPVLFLLTLSFETHPTQPYNPFPFHITSLSWMPYSLKNPPPGSTFVCFLGELDVYPQNSAIQNLGFTVPWQPHLHLIPTSTPWHLSPCSTLPTQTPSHSLTTTLTFHLACWVIHA